MEEKETLAEQPDAVEETTKTEEAPQGENLMGETQQMADPPEAQEEPTTGETSEAEGEQKKQQEQETEQQLTLKYYGKEVTLPAQQVVALAQKGLDYDKVRSERDSFKSGREMTLLNQYAAVSGMPLPQYLDYLEKGLEHAEVQREMQRGIPENAARELAKVRRETLQREQQEAGEKQRLAPFMELLQEYPDLKELPKEALQRIQKGESPLAAYRAVELQRLKNQKAAQDAAAQNRRTTPGTATGLGGKEKTDPFVAGFLDGFRD